MIKRNLTKGIESLMIKTYILLSEFLFAMPLKKALSHYMRNQKMLSIATVEENTPWITNVYYTMGDGYTIYFVSSQDAEHSKHIQKNALVAFGNAWYNKFNQKDRIGIQGQWLCKIVTDLDIIQQQVKKHNQKFPDFVGQITEDYITDRDTAAYLWEIKPTKIKFWNDKMLGDKNFETLSFDT